jgi:hypothetical protein
MELAEKIITIKNSYGGERNAIVNGIPDFNKIRQQTH